MTRLGQVSVLIGLDYDQSVSTQSLDGQQFTFVNGDPNWYTEAALGLDQSYLMSVRYTHGRDRFIVGDFETGTATIVLDNDTGEWTPNSGVNRIGGEKLRPGMPVIIVYFASVAELITILEAETGETWQSSSGFAFRDMTDTETTVGLVDGRTWTLHGSDSTLSIGNTTGTAQSQFSSGSYTRFLGRVLDVTDKYEEGGRGAITIVNVVDLMADLAQYNEVISATGAEATHTRWGTIWAAALNDGNMIGHTDTGIYQVETSTLPDNYLEEARVAARAEGGALYADHSGSSGRFVFKAANWLLEDPRSATVQASLGNGRIGVTGVNVTYNLLRVYNNILYSNSSTTTAESDASSIAAYSTRALTKEILNNDNTDLTSIAARDLAILKDAKPVIESIVINPLTVFEVLFCQQVAVGDLLEVTVDAHTFTFTSMLHVSGISESWDAATDDWTVTLRLDDRTGDTVIS